MYISQLFICHPYSSPSLHISALALAAARPEWSSLQDADISLHQCVLPSISDEASYDTLLILLLTIASLYALSYAFMCW